MPNNLPVPSDLQHLIEKRNGEDRRSAAAEPGSDSPPESGDKKTADRRQAIRRDEDKTA